MSRIIQDLLDVARFEAGMLEVERSPLFAADLVADAARAHQKPIEARGLELKVVAAGNLPLVRADRERVAQVFENLIGNAMKFTPSGTITIEARSVHGEVVFTVADTGVGVAPEHLPRLFDPFWQAPHGKREGAGLGLSIVKTIVDSHEGRSWATSTVGVGSTFYFTLPIASRSSDAVPTLDAASAAPDPVALVVDDDEDVRRAVARMLRQHGYVSVTAANGQEALDYLGRGERPAVIVLDLAMPVLDGWGFLEELHRSPDCRSIPVVVISGQSQVATRVSSMNATLVQKPVSPEELVGAMQRAMRSAPARAQA